MRELKVKFNGNPYRQKYPNEWNQLYEFMLSHKNSFGSIFRWASKDLNNTYRKLYDWIIEQTPLLVGDQYQAGTRIYWILNGLIDFPICEYCHSKDGYMNRNVSPYKEPYRQYCSISCTNKSHRHKQACIKSLQKHYHVDRYCQTDEGKRILGIKLRQRNYDTFVKNLKRRNVILLTDKDEYIQNGSVAINVYKCLTCGNIFQTRYTDAKHAVCQACKNSGISNEEREFRTVLASLTSSIPMFNARVLKYGQSWRNWKEIDVYFPDLKLGFEYDGIFFHSYENDIDTEYHLLKTKIAESLGIRLVHIRSDQWRNDFSYWKNLVFSMLNEKVNLLDYAVKKGNNFIFDRTIFNKCWFDINKFKILCETPPIVHNVFHKLQSFHYYDCGNLEIIEK